MTREQKNFLTVLTALLIVGFLGFIFVTTSRMPKNETAKKPAQVSQAVPMQPQSAPGGQLYDKRSQPVQASEKKTPVTATTEKTQVTVEKKQVTAVPSQKAQQPPAKQATEQKSATVPAGKGAGGKTLADMISKEMPTMVDFGAEWCPACKQMKPIVNQIEKEYKGRVMVIYIDVDQNKQITSDNNITAIPTQMFFDKDGKMVLRHVGVLQIDEVRDQLEKMGIK